ncbi:gluconate 2-dehydrogenase subunit 3 family protein [Algibacillus agarilyticus]|uniref:gluconate 2-dehydrogenase subunit 3 family protein n=1 Tax=Algibacillus agarilyticus TaxID=2234133 RepID=UPI000DD04BCC|nr:gluconate 2-dehydrogenase subunit 3 family protein [Algibacillus agarilyticus]
MLDNKITRRVFLGTTLCVVTAPLFATLLNEQNNLQKVLMDGQFFNAAELTLLTDVAEIMIPKTDTPGATDAHVIPVLDGLMLTWAGVKSKRQFRFIVAQINDLAKSTYGSVYNKLAFDDRFLLIEQLDKTAFANKKSVLSTHYRRLKEMVFHIYYTSEEANPDFILIPGGYRGSLSKQELDTIQARGYL